MVEWVNYPIRSAHVFEVTVTEYWPNYKKVAYSKYEFETEILNNTKQ